MNAHSKIIAKLQLVNNKNHIPCDISRKITSMFFSRGETKYDILTKNVEGGTI